MTEGRLQGRRVVVGIGGGIAGYKAIEVIRLLTDAGAQVRVMMTPEATRFVTPMKLDGLTALSVEMMTTRSAFLARADSQTNSVPSTLLTNAWSGLASTSGTCL